jgi:hypothetical protein
MSQLSNWVTFWELRRQHMGRLVALKTDEARHRAKSGGANQSQHLKAT